MSLFHYMALATPEAWARLLSRHHRWTGLWALVRVSLGIAVSLGVFVVTLPERIVLAPLLRRRFGGAAPVFEHAPGVVVILGYYRSGTTHLHNLLSCDRRFVTPRWVQAMSPHGFRLSWAALRLVLTPLMPNTRPQDEVAFGPGWPAEDDFALNNWVLASALPGRLMYPSDFGHYQRWHFLEGLSGAELSRWRRAEAAFCWKVTRGRARRRLLLKTPSHTARVAELRRLFGDSVRFVLIERDREQVLRSNVRMAERLRGFLLERGPDEATLRARLEDELSRTERALEAQSSDLGPDRLVRVGFDELTSDPVGLLRRVYDALGLGWNDDVEGRVRAYLKGVGRYTPAHATTPAGDRGADEDGARPRVVRGIGLGLVAGAAVLGGWLLWAGLVEDRHNVVAWPLGFGVGMGMLLGAGRGGRWLGAAAVGIFAACLATAIYWLPEVAYGWEGRDRWISIRTDLNHPHGWVWILLGLLTAYRCASRRHVRPPG